MVLLWQLCDLRRRGNTDFSGLDGALDIWNGGALDGLGVPKRALGHVQKIGGGGLGHRNAARCRLVIKRRGRQICRPSISTFSIVQVRQLRSDPNTKVRYAFG
ncbi:hypothetical protein U0C82_12885 [Fulvimarina sp. 2208YS6-2-32]|uniref:Uncharacterized protein n=1 Tax=Fulvimarina uroteuthidis TaxID=3098149 RepID=A0ABU5I4L5_9HYPH|nr:hypothetical protein [Fulvimarina sp. 2208YS6-2-32]